MPEFYSSKAQIIGLFFFCFFACSINPLRAQDKKLVVYREKAEQAFRNRELPKAKEYYQKILSLDSSDVSGYYRLGQIAQTERDEAAATRYFEKVMAVDADNKAYVQAHSFLARHYREKLAFDKAILHYTKAIHNMPPNSKAIGQLNKELSSCKFAKDARVKPMIVHPHKMSETLNFKDIQYFPAFTADEETIFFTARMNGEDEDIYTAIKKEGSWQNPEKISEQINTAYNEGTCTISTDGKTMVFTACEGRNGLGGCDLYISHLDSAGWSQPENLGPAVNSPEWDSEASLSADGKLLFFSSSRFVGLGGKDLYFTALNSNGIWAKAQNLGTMINTIYDEVSPFLHANGNTLFFASNGHESLGGFDVFMADKQQNSFSKPQNLGFPINDEKDQFSLVVSADGKKAYYAEENNRRVDLFEFDLPDELAKSFNSTYYIKGRVVNAEGQALAAALQLIDLKTSETLAEFAADTKGSYLIALPAAGEYALFVQHEGYFFKSIPFDFERGFSRENKVIDIELERVEKGRAEALNNIYFAEGSWELEPESEAELNKLSSLIEKNKVKVEILGHTDDVGKEEDNLILSQKRAESVVSYLIDRGIDRSSLSAKGLGETMPVLSNDSVESRSRNRRIEFRFF